MGYATENHTARELYLFAKHSRHVQQRGFEPEARVMERKRLKGVYDPERALKAWKYIADFAAQEYVKAHCEPGCVWWRQFTVQDRMDCAREFLHEWTCEIECGNSWLERAA